ncbi:MAG: hypothetical protein ACI4WP_02025 [Bacilli bacterium]
MPNIFIHEKVAYNIAKENKYLDTPNFYLGVLTPDAVNLNGFAPKEERWTSHLRDKNLSTWRQNIIDFYNKEKSNYASYFLDGYLIHILTDIIFDDYFYSNVIDLIKKDHKDIEDAHPLLLKSMNDYAIVNKDDKLVGHIKEKLNNADSFNIRNISKEQLLSWSKKQLNYNESSSITNPYITDDLIEKITTQVSKEYFDIVKE